MENVSEINSCTACSVCAQICPVNAITVVSEDFSNRPQVNETACINCGLCLKKCPQLNLVETKEPILWLQGWSNDSSIRKSSSSGGIATELIRSYLAAGKAVCAFAQTENGFEYLISSNPEDFSKFKGSKYLKSDPSNVFKDILSVLIQGNKMLFIGLPCQVAALLKFIPDKFHNNLLTVDLICHGTPSYSVFDNYLNDLHLKKTPETISFRDQNGYLIKLDDNYIYHSKVQDEYSTAFKDGLISTYNCYSCNYSSVKRVSDITLGDSWGSELVEEIPKGLSLILVNTSKGKAIIEALDITTFPVDQKKAISSNDQLQKPADIPANRQKFIRYYRKYGFKGAFFRVYPKTYIRRRIKYLLIKSGMMN